MGHPTTRRSSLTDVVVRFADIVIPDRNVQGLLGQVAVFDIIEKLLQWENTHITPCLQGNHPWKTAVKNCRYPEFLSSETRRRYLNGSSEEQMLFPLNGGTVHKPNQNHRITESIRLEKMTEIIPSNCIVHSLHLTESPACSPSQKPQNLQPQHFPRRCRRSLARIPYWIGGQSQRNVSPQWVRVPITPIAILGCPWSVNTTKVGLTVGKLHTSLPH